MSNRKERIRLVIIAIASLLIIAVGGFYIYTLDYYRADGHALQMLSSNSSRIERYEDIIIIYPEKHANNNIGFIFYPGGKIEASSYIPFLDRLSQEGLTCFLMEMPLKLAIFDIDAAEETLETFPEIERWFLGGHSLGGAMASSYMGDPDSRIAGLILLGAYPVNEATIPTIAIYGSEDEGLDLSKLEGTANVHEIIGGNHAYFGNYGEQEGDGTAWITREEQQEIAVMKIMEFITTTDGANTDNNKP